jgi:hypothetical protein
MAATRTVQTGEANERAAVEPFAAELLDVARRVDPEATYTLAPPIDAGIWIMHLHVRLDLADKADLRNALAERKTDFLIEHGVGLATMFHDRMAGAPPEGSRGKQKATT